MNKVTIGITTYNLEKYIAQALDSVLMQKTNFDFDILVIDDASTDKTQAIIKKYAKKYPQKVKYLFNKKNGGSLYSSNKLFNHIHSPYISFLDGDDYWLDENRLQKQVDFLDTHPDYTMVGGNTLYLKDNKISGKVVLDQYLNKDYSWQDKVNDVCPFVHTSALLLRNVIYNKGVPSEYIKAQDTKDNSVYRGEDIRFLHHLEKGKLYVFPDDVSVYRIHNAGLWQSASLNKRLLEGMIGNLRYLDIFPSAQQKWEKDFIALYNAFLNNLIDGYNLSNKEYELFQCILDLLKDKKINFSKMNSVQKKIQQLKGVKKIKYKILLKIYKYCQKKLCKKGYINDKIS